MFIRKLEKMDYPAVKTIYQQGIDSGNATFQQSAKRWQEWDSSMLSTCRIVAEKKEKIVGWAALSPVSSREVYSGVAEVSVYVAEQEQRKGVGQNLISQLILESEKNNIWMLQAGIFPENIGSIKLHTNNAFRQLCVREKLACMDGVWRNVALLERRSKVVGIG